MLQYVYNSVRVNASETDDPAEQAEILQKALDRLDA